MVCIYVWRAKIAQAQKRPHEIRVVLISKWFFLGRVHTDYVNFRLASDTLFVRIPSHLTKAATVFFCPLPSFTPSMIYSKHFAYENHRQISRRIRCDPVNGKRDVVDSVLGKISRFVLWMQITFFRFEYMLHLHLHLPFRLFEIFLLHLQFLWTQTFPNMARKWVCDSKFKNIDANG